MSLGEFECTFHTIITFFCYFRLKAGLLNQGALLTTIHIAGDQTPLLYTGQFRVGMFHVSHEVFS